MQARTWFIAAVVLILVQFALDAFADTDWDAIAIRCSPPQTTEPPILQSDFKWNYTQAEMADKFQQMYNSPKRLYGRAYYDSSKGNFILPYGIDRAGPVTLSRNFVKVVTSHIERAVKATYVEHVFFPDMGHSHFFIPEEAYAQEYRQIPVGQFARLYEKLFADERVYTLYHTAEQLKMLDPDSKQPLPDRKLQWRLYTRNLLGQNKVGGDLMVGNAIEHTANTMGTWKGFRYYGGGFNISANHNGCFPVTINGQTLYFDISMEDLPYSSATFGRRWLHN